MVWGFCDLVCLSFAGTGMAVEGGGGGSCGLGCGTRGFGSVGLCCQVTVSLDLAAVTTDSS